MAGHSARAARRRAWVATMLALLVALLVAVAAVFLAMAVSVGQRGMGGGVGGGAGRIAPPLVAPVELMPLTIADARAANMAQPFATTAMVAAPPLRFIGGPDDAQRAVHCLTAALLYEAGDDGDGQRAVAQVVLNRARHPAFPATICGVVFQGSERRTGCQFSFTCDGALQRRYPAEMWQRAQGNAILALNGFVYAPVGLATHYHTDWVRPYWSPSLDKVAQVGTHLFFRWPGWWGTAAAFRRGVSGQ
ncbi:MAG: cell wall hydrolase, partial [Sphingopyxis sp.]